MNAKNAIFIGIAVVFVGLIVWVGGLQQKAPQKITPTVSPEATKTVETKTTINTDTKKTMTTAILTTNKGAITLEFYDDRAPKTVENFVKLAKEGFYNGTRFHRVIKGFMIQGGDPLSKDLSMKDRWGMGGPGYSFADEIDPNSDLYKAGYQRGVLAMANSGPNTNGSQFFIMHQDYALPPSYTIFGRVTSGIDVVDAIANTKTGINDRPLEDVIIEKIEVK